MAATYEPIATTTLGSNQTSVTFSAISGTYTDLVLITNVSGDSGRLGMRFNSDTGSNYSLTWMRANGGAIASNTYANLNYIYSTSSLAFTAGTLQTGITHIQNYSNTTTYKTVLLRDGMTTHMVGVVAGLWRDTSAITSIQISPDFATSVFYSGSTFTLYGIKAA